MQKSEISTIRKLFNQSAHYFTGSFLGIIVHFITFPIFTRIFSIADYGILGLVTVTLSTILAVSKFGINNGAIRFYEDCRLEKNRDGLPQYYSTFLIATITASGVVSLLFVLSVINIPENILAKKITNLLAFTSVIIFLKCTYIIFQSFNRAEQKTKTFNFIELITGYCSIGLSIFFIFCFVKGLYGFYTGQIVVFNAAVLIFFYSLLRRRKIRIKYFSKKLFFESIKYGMPLMAFELMNHVLTYADRYLIQYYLGSERLGIYSVGYNISQYLSNLFLLPVSLVITPVLMDTWTNKGVEDTKIFLSDSLKYFLLIIFPVVFGFIAVSGDLISFLASEKYHESYQIVPPVIIGMTFFTLTYIFNAGLTIFKKTGRILIFSGISAVINVVLNLLLIPKYDISGAAYATLISYLIFFMLIVFSSFKYLSFKIPVFTISKYLVFALLMSVIVKITTIDVNLLNLLVKIVVGVVVYSFLILLFDKEIRKKCFALIAKLNG